ncbi:MAG: B12-binding domain-containing radical SAM protein [Omnitrophica bacterium]|nr:B12-binding domain-containing radical SAM protein [Candidatus Omnitrophota bacterium]
MKILLVNPPSKFLIDDNVFPTLGLLYLSAYLKRKDYNDVTLLDLNGNHVIPEAIEADVVGFYSNTPQFPYVVKLKEVLARINMRRSAIYVIGGPHVSGRPEDALPHFDYVISGEGERAFLDLVDSASGKTDMPKGQIIKYQYIEDINTIPFPDRALVDIKSYKYLIEGVPATTLVTSRGCPFGCAFCANNAWGKTLRLRDPENVTEEMQILIEQYGFKAFMFFDDTMTVSKKRMEILCNRIKKLDIIYRCFIRADTVDREILTKMKESGCVEVGMGMESGSQRILDTINKGQSVRQNLNIAKLCKQVGISIKGFFVVGLPGEDRNSVHETIKFIEESKVDDLDITVFAPYPGSRIYEYKHKYDISFETTYESSWYKGKPGFYRSAVSTSGLNSEEIVKIRNKMEKRFKKEQGARETGDFAKLVT